METVRLQQLRLLNDLTLALNHASESDEIYRVVLECIPSILPVEHVRIVLRSAEANMLDVVASASNSSSNELHVNPISIVDGSISSGMIQYIEDFRDYSADLLGEEYKGDIRTVFCAPFIVRGQPTGFLQVESTQVDAYSEYDLEVLQLIALQVTNALTDQTLLQEIHERVKEAEENSIFLESLIEHFPNPFFVKEATDLQYVHCNAAFVEMVATKRENIIGKSDFDFLPFEEADFFRKMDREVLQSGEVLDIPEETIGSGVDRIRYLHTIKVPVSTHDGHPLYMLGISEDITERRKAEEALKLANIVVENSAVVLFRWRAEAGLPIEYVSDNVKQFGYSANALTATATSFATLIHPNDADWAMQNALSLTPATESEFSRTFRLITSDDEMKWVEAKVQIERGKEGATAHFQGVLIDITEQKANEKLLRQAKDNAEAANQTKSMFLSNMTHELRTPMNGVLGMASLLGETDLTDVQRDMLGLIHFSGDTLLTIINDILDISKIEANKLELERVSFNIITCVEETFAIVQPSTIGKDITLTYGIDEKVPKRVIQDVTRVRQILTNLINNAIKFTEFGSVEVAIDVSPIDTRIDTPSIDAPHTDLDAVTNSQMIYFSVEDSGIGIPAERCDHLFEPFSQVDPSTTRKYGGTGLGLPISKHLCEMMGGSMWVESELGVGSTFYFTIVSENEHDSSFSEADDERARRISGYDSTMATEHPLRILVAEDNVVNQKVVLGMLKNLGYTANIVANGFEAIDALNRQPYDVILMDINMPEMDGITATQHIRSQMKQGETIVIIAVTASVLTSHRKTYADVGMDDFISKPIRVPELVDALKRITL